MADQSARRIRVTLGHLDHAAPSPASSPSVEVSATAALRDRTFAGKVPNVQLMDPSFDTLEMERWFAHDNHALRAEMQQFFAQEKFRMRNADLSLAERRDLNTEWTMAAIKAGYIKIRELRTDPHKYFASVESLCVDDPSMTVKYSVQYNLFAVSILNIGSAYHHDKYLDRIDRGEVFGCFAMTELGHGSNVRCLETTATYDRARQEFVIHSPTTTAQKYWLGNCAVDASHAVVFAQLIIDHKSYGVHPFVVQLRDGVRGKLRPGVRIRDCGVKQGLNGIDNGRIMFNHVRIPREEMLNKFANVSPDGTYKTVFKNQTVNFVAHIGELIAARLSVATGSVSLCKVPLIVATRYAFTRRQFGMKGQPEVRLIDYLSHQRRVLPMIAATYAWQAFCVYTKHRYATRADADKEVHIIVASAKAGASWFLVECTQLCRELCGGQGYKASNKICVARNDGDIFVTLDGDNTVLYQQVAKSLLDGLKGEVRKNGTVSVVMSAFARELGAQVFDKNYFAVRNTSSSHLRSSRFQMMCMMYRERRMLQSLAARLQNKRKQGVAAFEAWNSCLDHTLRLAQAFVDRIVLEQFILSTRKAEPGLRPVLRKLRALFGLYQMEKDMGWFASHGLLSGSKVTAIHNEINALCGELKGESLGLVEAFGIPDYLVNTTVAGDWVSLNEFK